MYFCDMDYIAKAQGCANIVKIPACNTQRFIFNTPDFTLDEFVQATFILDGRMAVYNILYDESPNLVVTIDFTIYDLPINVELKQDAVVYNYVLTPFPNNAGEPIDSIIIEN